MTDDPSSLSPPRKPGKLSWTFVTLLLIALLVMTVLSCILPVAFIAVQSLREATRREQARQNVNQLKAALEAYEDRESLPAASP